MVRLALAVMGLAVVLFGSVAVRDYNHALGLERSRNRIERSRDWRDQAMERERRLEAGIARERARIAATIGAVGDPEPAIGSAAAIEAYLAGRRTSAVGGDGHHPLRGIPEEDLLAALRDLAHERLARLERERVEAAEEARRYARELASYRRRHREREQPILFFTGE